MLSPPLSSPSISTPSNQSGATPIPSTPSPLKESPSQGPVASQTSPARRGPQSPHVLMPLPCKKGEVLQYNNFKCPECQTQFTGKAELVAHFQQIRATPNSVSSTPVFVFSFVTKCKKNNFQEYCYTNFFNAPSSSSPLRPACFALRQ